MLKYLHCSAGVVGGSFPGERRVWVSCVASKAGERAGGRGRTSGGCLWKKRGNERLEVAECTKEGVEKFQNFCTVIATVR